MTERLSDGMVITQPISDIAWNQYWKITKNEDNTYSIQNVYSSKSLNRKAVNENSGCGGNYITTSSTSANHKWNIAQGNYAWQTTFNFIEPNKPTTGLATNASGLSVNSGIELTQAQWIAKRVELTEEQIEAAKTDYSENQLLLNSSTVILNNR